MIDKYEEIFKRYKSYIEENSIYNAKVVKTNTSASSYFPIISCVLTNIVDTDRCTLGHEEYYEQLYITINIYTKDKILNDKQIASQEVNNELIKLTINFFTKLNMKRTLCQPTPNLDSLVLRTTIQYQGMVGNVRGNIIRR